MTASPTAVPHTPLKVADGGNALAALFAAAAANSMHRQISSPKASPMTSININNNRTAKDTTTAAAAAAMLASINSSSSPASKKQKNQETTPIDKDCGNDAAQFIANLMHNASKQQKQQQQHQKQFNLSGVISNKSSINDSTNKSASRQDEQTSILAQSVPKATKASTIKKAVTNSSTPTTVSRTKVSDNLTAKSTNVTREIEQDNSVELRNLQTWHDEDGGLVDESCYQELVDSCNSNGWSADEMFKYNEKRHKVTSSYNEKTLGDKYTTPLPQNKSKTALRMATKLAKEIEDKVQLEGRVTPESSDDDEMFELERTRRIQLKQQKHLDQLKSLKAINSLSIHSQNGRISNNNGNLVDHTGSTSGSSDSGSQSQTNYHHTGIPRLRSNPNNHVTNGSRRSSNKSSSRQSNSSTTPITASLSSSPTLNDSMSHHVTKMTSSSRNILRTCLI